ADAKALDGLGIENRGYQRLALARFRIRKVEATRLDIGLQVRLVPQRVAAGDDRHRAHAPALVRIVRPFQRAGIPGVEVTLRRLRLRAEDIDDEGCHTGCEDEGTDGRDQVEPVPADV